MSQENVDKARDFIAAYNRRDFDAAVESFDAEIEWVAPRAPELGFVPRSGRGQALLGGT
jgi:ketosteroid isomerase-like protein